MLLAQYKSIALRSYTLKNFTVFNESHIFLSFLNECQFGRHVMCVYVDDDDSDMIQLQILCIKFGHTVTKIVVNYFGNYVKPQTNCIKYQERRILSYRHCDMFPNIKTILVQTYCKTYIFFTFTQDVCLTPFILVLI